MLYDTSRSVQSMYKVTKQHEKLIVEISINGIYVIDRVKRQQINNWNPTTTKKNNFSPLDKWHHIIFQKLKKINNKKMRPRGRPMLKLKKKKLHIALMNTLMVPYYLLIWCFAHFFLLYLSISGSRGNSFFFIVISL